MIPFTHPSTPPTIEGTYMIVGWYGDTSIATWKDDGTKYGSWLINDELVDNDRITGYRPHDAEELNKFKRLQDSISKLSIWRESLSDDHLIRSDN